MKMLQRALLATALAAFAAAPAFAQNQAQAKPKVSGEVTVVNEFTNQVTVRTTEVPGMGGKATSVAFIAKDAAELKTYKVGAKVTGDLVVKGNDTYLENVKPGTGKS